MSDERTKQTTPDKSPFDMTVAELQAEIGKLQSILHCKVLGDPRESVTVHSHANCLVCGKISEGALCSDCLPTAFGPMQ